MKRGKSLFIQDLPRYHKFMFFEVYSSTAACAADIGCCNRTTYNGGVILGMFLVFLELLIKSDNDFPCPHIYL